MSYEKRNEIEDLHDDRGDGTPGDWPNSGHSWHFIARGGDPRPQYRLLGEVDVRMPSPEDCIVPVLEALAKREQEIRTESYEELQKIKQRRNDLMMLSAPVIPEAKESEL